MSSIIPLTPRESLSGTTYTVRTGRGVGGKEESKSRTNGEKIAVKGKGGKDG